MDKLTVENLIAHGKNIAIADAKRMAERPRDMPRNVWRDKNPIEINVSFSVVDNKLKTKPRRKLSFCLNGNAFDLWIWTDDKRSKSSNIVSRINLLSDNAAELLARFELSDK